METANYSKYVVVFNNIRNSSIKLMHSQTQKTVLARHVYSMDTFPSISDARLT